MRIDLPYGSATLQFEVPDDNLMGVYPPNHVRGVKDEKAALQHAINQPTGSEPLAQLAKGKKHVVILATDNTRPTKDHIIVPAILQALSEAHIPKDRTKIVIARGQHRRMTAAEIEQKLGKSILDQVQVVQHDPDGPVLNIGTTQRGNRILLNRLVAEADLVVGTGDIVPHSFAGFGGGAKIILPGVCARETTQRNHLYVLEQDTRAGSIDGNAVRAEMEEAAEKAGLDFIVNTVMNHKGEIVKAVAGHPFKAHREGVNAARLMYEVPVPRKADVIVASSSPMDLDFYQASKALEMGESAIRTGGQFILVSPCPDGVGDEDLRSFLRIGSPDDILRALKSVKPEVNLVCGIIAYILTRVKERMNITVISGGLSEREVSEMGLRKEESVQLAIDKALSADDRMIAVFPRGAVTLPKL